MIDNYFGSIIIIDSLMLAIGVSSNKFPLGHY